MITQLPKIKWYDIVVTAAAAAILRAFGVGPHDPQVYLGVTGAIITAGVIGAAGSYLSAKESNKSRTAHTDQTTEPQLFGSTIDDLNRILEDQAKLYAQGPPDYSKIYGGGGKGVGERGNEAMDIYRQVAERGLGAGSTPGVQFGQNAIGSIWGTDASGGGPVPVDISSWSSAGFGSRREAVEAARAAGWQGDPGADLGSGLAVLQQQGALPAQREAQAAHEARYPGAGAGTGFEGYNPILAGVASELQGSSMDVPMDLLMQFLGENNRAGGGGPASNAPTEGNLAGPRTAASYGSVSGFSSPGYGGGGGGRVPDTGSGNGLFQTQIQKMFDEGGHEEEIAALLDSVGGDIERQGFKDMADLEARASGQGKFGGDWHSEQIAEAKRRQAEEIAQISAQLRYGDLDAQRQAKLRALEILNSRDVAAMQDATNRAGISASSSSAAAGRALSEKLANMENDRLLRGQDLSAIGALMQGQQFGLSGLMSMGDRLSTDRLSSLSMVPQFEGLGLSGLDRALGAAGGMSGLEQIDAAARARGAANRTQAGLAQAQAPQRMINDYLNTIGIVNQIGGGSHTYGTNVVPGAGVNAGGAALQGGLGAGLAAAGIAGQYGYLGNNGT